MAKAYLNILKKIFRFTTGKLPDSEKATIVPAEVSDSGKLRKVKFSDDIQDLYKYWLKDTYDTSDTIKDRIERYSSLEFAYYNNSIFSKAINLYSDEVIQEDQQSEPINVDSPNKKATTYIKDLFSMLKIDQQKIRDIAFHIALYGDGVWITPTNGDEGFTDAIPTSVYNIEDILEFNAADEAKKKKRKRSFGSFIDKDTRLQALEKMLDEIENDYSNMFQTFLFGYQLSKDLYLPPWNVSHFKTFTTLSEFAPFGRPLMINSLAPFRQLQSAKNLMALARATGFPTKVFKVLADDTLDPMSKWEIVNQAREQYANLGNEPTGKEQFTMDSEVWIPQGLIDFDTFESRVNLDQIADVELLRDDMIMATDIPKGYLIVDRGAFGTSSQSLLAQHKPFARKVYSIQSSILHNIAELVKLQFAMTGAFDYDEKFELTMAFPSTEESSDRLRIKNDTLRLAKDVLDNLGQAIGLDRGEAMPPDVVKRVFQQLSFLDGEDVESWIDAVIDARQSEENPLDENKKYKIMERLSPQLIKEAYFNSKQSIGLHEGVIGQKHFFMSNQSTSMQKKYLKLLADSRGKNKVLKG